MIHESKELFSKFTNKYSLSKTLRFELKPMTETKDHLKEFVDSDEIRAKEYKELKKIIDEFHKDHIENTLSSKNILENKDLNKLYKLWNLRDDKANEKEIEDLQKKLRKQIVVHFESANHLLKSFFETAEEERLEAFLKSFDKKLYEGFSEKKDKRILNKYLEKPKKLIKKLLFSKEFVRYILPEWLEKSNLLEKEKKQKIIKNFDKWTTYLNGFYENRQNMYSDQEQGTAIAHRIINENLPKFFSNVTTYKKIESNYKELTNQLANIRQELKEEFEYFDVKQIDGLFDLEVFNKCLSQKGIDHYNTLLGGKVLKEKGEKLKGVNEYVNLYRQVQKSKNHKDKEIVTKYSSRNLPVMELLYKQILSDRESHSFVLNHFDNKKELLGAIQKFSDLILEKKDNEKQSVFEKINQLFTKELLKSERDLNSIYVKGSQINAISNSLFGDWNIIYSALRDYSDKNSSQKSKTKSKENKLKKDFYSFEEINKALTDCLTQSENWPLKGKKRDLPQKNLLVLYFKHLLSFSRNEAEPLFDKLKNETKDGNELLKSFKQAQKEFKEVYNSSPEEERQGFIEKETRVIQNFLNLFMDLFHIIDAVYLEKDKIKRDLDKDNSFYNDLEAFRESLFPVISLYNKTRNFILSGKRMKKKVKINFEDSTLLDGWDVNKETDNLAVLLRRKEDNFWKYYLGIMNKNRSKKANFLFDYHIKDNDSEQKKRTKEKLKNKILYDSDDKNFYEKMNYKQISSANKDIQNLIPIKNKIQRKTKNLEELKKEYLPPEIWRIKQTKSYSVDKNSNSFNKKDLMKFIDFYKKVAKNYWKEFTFNFKNSDEYNKFTDFTDDIDSQGYKIFFDKIKSSYIKEKMKTGELLLFEIYNKDFSTNSENRGKSRDNLHTIYFKGLFEEENLKDIVLKLNGRAEVFYRKASSDKKHVTHPKNQAIKNKNEKGNPKKTSKFKYDLIKDKRFFEDKFFFHFPISLNFKQKEIPPFSFNQEVLRFLKDQKGINIIGIDRGERHLAYYTVIDQNKKILEQGSFNKMEYSYKNRDGQEVKVEKDYHELLEGREKQRDKSRKEWQKIESIKELKSGYLSYLVHKLSQLMIDHNAVVVFEDLNSGFKRGRFKFERQVYQKLEKALIDKLNYLVFKDKKALETGGYLKAYQLTAPFESFKKMGKQTGFLFYTPAYYTSKVCPLTGFVNTVYPHYRNVKKSQEFFNKFGGISFNKKNDYFVFEYEDSKFQSKKDKNSKSFWKLCTVGKDRYQWDNTNRKFILVNVTEELKELFDKYEIDYKQIEDLKSLIVKQTEKDFFLRLTNLLKVTLQLRYTNPNTTDKDETDFILSPVSDKHGRFFDSRKAKDHEPKNADANGAYHIALKGLMSLQNIKTDGKKIKLQIQSIKNKEWFEFIRQNKRGKLIKAS